MVNLVHRPSQPPSRDVVLILAVVDHRLGIGMKVFDGGRVDVIEPYERLFTVYGSFNGWILMRFDW